MSSGVLSRAAQGDYAAWEPASFDTVPHDLPASHYPDLSLPTLEQIAGIQEQAHQEGYQAGLSEGREAGLAEGRAQARAENARLAMLAAGFSAASQDADALIARQLLDLSLDLAQAMLKSVLAIQPERVLPVVREAVRYLPLVQAPARLMLHPADVQLVREHMGEALEKSGWQLIDDPQIAPGGCRIETASNQIDASLPTRWQRLLDALGKQGEWLST
jgi:flagellar assembly protein FliH